MAPWTARMRFAEIGDTREWSEPSARRSGGIAVHPEDIELEAWRRKAALGIDEWRMREYVTGVPVPDRIDHYCQQIEFAAQALMRLSPIPSDFRNDVYWPRCW
ncbi:hypothetical protein DEVEQU_03973 [Devosia equisanguinis]|uniref:Uncharacterized protein n=2 Tax=Devosiaceae TaxID=2831106 RepID=A0A3S4CVL1_9HYPH|nr:hypothetical protein DEVEQU_03973 [Devosia equisanguinis]